MKKEDKNTKLEFKRHFESLFYITTPIYYINDKPHIGTFYTTIIADTIARFMRQKDEDVIFLTGVDEHSQKTVDSAKKANEDIISYTDKLAKKFEDAWNNFNISNSDFIRTSEERHISTVIDFWDRLDAADDIYLDEYSGLYCNGCEEFKKESDLIDGLCPMHKTKPELITESNYFFRLSKYQKQLLDFYELNPDFIFPENRFNEIKKFVESGLEDISFSREGKDWGIPVPRDSHQVIYVWADALVNYISAVGIEGWEEHPADIHFIGKDILRFHAVIWPAMLMSAGLPLPGKIVANGFLTINGSKISKSLGNSIDPFDLVKQYGIDALRYFLLREIPFGQDGDFSIEKMKDRYNSDFANGLGNFTSRILSLASRENIDIEDIDKEFDEKIKIMNLSVLKKINDFKFNEALMAIWDVISFGDFYINEQKIWAIKDDKLRKKAILNCLILLYSVAQTLTPFLPETSKKIKDAFSWTVKNVTVKKIDNLFPRV
jgi:methionyl-tRNA synthetase